MTVPQNQENPEENLQEALARISPPTRIQRGVVMLDSDELRVRKRIARKQKLPLG